MDKNMYTLPKKLVLDYSKWNCGEPNRTGYVLREIEKYTHGKGESQLINSENEMCCLGQFGLQAGIPRKLIKNKRDYNDSETGSLHIEDLNIIDTRYDKGYINSELGNEAITINDNTNTTIAEKVSLLQRLFKNKGYIITLKNFPRKVLKELK